MSRSERYFDLYHTKYTAWLCGLYNIWSNISYMAFLSSASTTSQDLADTSVCFPCTDIVNVIGSLVHYINVSK